MNSYKGSKFFKSPGYTVGINNFCKYIKKNTKKTAHIFPISCKEANTDFAVQFAFVENMSI